MNVHHIKFRHQWKVQLGSCRSIEEYHEGLASRAVEVRTRGEYVLSQISVSPYPRTVQLVECSLSDIGLPKDSPYEHILARVREIAEVVPCEAVFARHCQYPVQDLRGLQYIVCEPIEIDGEDRILVTNDVFVQDDSVRPVKVEFSHQLIGVIRLREASMLDDHDDSIVFVLPDRED